MEWLNYHHLRYFWTVAKEGSLKQAAENLRVSQPSISAQLSELEEVLGEKLFRRRGRSKVLTDAGQVAYRYADEIFTLGRELMNAIKQRPTAQALRLYVGVADSFPKLVTNEILKPVFSMPQPVHVICREASWRIYSSNSQRTGSTSFWPTSRLPAARRSAPSTIRWRVIHLVLCVWQTGTDAEERLPEITSRRAGVAAIGQHLASPRRGGLVPRHRRPAAGGGGV